MLDTPDVILKPALLYATLLFNFTEAIWYPFPFIQNDQSATPGS